MTGVGEDRDVALGRPAEVGPEGTDTVSRVRLVVDQVTSSRVVTEPNGEVLAEVTHVVATSGEGSHRLLVLVDPDQQGVDLPGTSRVLHDPRHRRAACRAPNRWEPKVPSGECGGAPNLRLSFEAFRAEGVA